MTTLSCFPPSPWLAPYIEAFTFYEGETTGGRERCLPDGQIAVVINLGHDLLHACASQQQSRLQSFRGGVLTGAFSQASVIDTSTMVRTISIVFKAGGARPFLGMPTDQLTNQVVDLYTLWGRTALLLREQLLTVQTNLERVHALERFLLARAAWEETTHPAISFALASFHQTHAYLPIAQVTDQLGMRPKRFIHLFKEAVGLTPKMYCRLLRFQETLRTIERGRPVHWSDLALSKGYFDQSHLIHDFQTFAGLTPVAYLVQRGDFHNHVPLPSKENFLQDSPTLPHLP